MIGVNIDKLENIISKLESVEDSSKSDDSNIGNSFSELSSCYSGSSLDYVFNCPAGRVNIHKIISNYIKTLKAVEKSYVRQDEIFRDQLTHIDSTL